MRCQAHGYPKPVFSWQFENNAIEASEKFLMDEKTRELVIRRVEAGDEGRYRCVASNGGVGDSREGRLIVKNTTTILDGPTDMEKSESETVRMLCRVVHDPSENLTVEWRKDNTVIVFDERIR